ncbi:MAG: two-component system response regulator [Nitrospinae bacterium CG11_big_fil_rev_8_21_14_0_20_45_15]|nr:MAG: two-component system response regulator [Nitrospinae bacterium CG11_big_fil_rev_8_21_14_0_20_45_15]
MIDSNKKHIVLVVEDDADDFFLISRILKTVDFKFKFDIIWVKDGLEAMDYLLRREKWQDPALSPLPSLILLDINMPKKNGLEVLKEIKTHETLKNLITIIFTSSKNELNIVLSYELGANSYIHKSSEIDQLEKKIKLLFSYWLEVAELPSRASDHSS